MLALLEINDLFIGDNSMYTKEYDNFVATTKKKLLFGSIGNHSLREDCCMHG